MTSVVPALYTAVAAFTQPGDQVILQRPVYGPFTGAVEDQGRVVSNNALVLENSRYTMDFADLERRARRSQGEAHALVQSSQPGGPGIYPEELEQVAQICQRHQVVLFADEIHGDFVYPGASHIPAGSVTQNCLVAVAPSKTFNLAGMKAASVISPDPALAARFKEALAVNHGGSMNLLGMYAYIAAYTHGDEYLTQLLAYLAGNIRYLADFLRENTPDIRLVQPEGTYLMWLDCRAMGMDQEALTHFFTWQAGVAMNAGTGSGGGNRLCADEPGLSPAKPWRQPCRPLPRPTPPGGEENKNVQQQANFACCCIA